MEKNYNSDGVPGEFNTSRLDLKTRICFMAAFIYGTGDLDTMTVEKAVEKAVEIENLSDARVVRMKSENPVARKKSTRG